MRDRVYQFSSNRGAASHRVRYVEGSHGLTENQGECRLCASSLFIENEASATSCAVPTPSSTDQDATS